MIDSHCHLDHEPLFANISEVLKRSKENGVKKILTICTTIQGFNNIKNILEVGTFTGYSALSMALSLPQDGRIICLDKNKETSKNAKSYFIKANVENKINIIIANALDTMEKLIIEKQFFDLIFIDADKENYTNYYKLSLQLLNKCGLVIIDNVLWKGLVADPDNNDDLTKTIREFNSFVKNDDNVETTILSLGDGITVCRKL